MPANPCGSRLAVLVLAGVLVACGAANVPTDSDASIGDAKAASPIDAQYPLDSSVEEDASRPGADASSIRDAGEPLGLDAAALPDAAPQAEDSGALPGLDASAPDASADAAIADAGVPQKQGPYGDCSGGLASCTVPGSECSKDSTGSVCAPPCAHDQDCPPLAGSAASPKCAVFGPSSTSHCYIACVNIPADTCPAPMMCLALFAPSPQCGWECPTGWCK